ncbi:MAG: DUF2283 domain-containing protein [Candidatus Nanohaloarchaea archaeon]|nr:DUF2283 domain-containing protein [Candidatus Nanohaloarchaea archaeon]
MKATYDPEADAMYIPLGDAEVSETRAIEEGTILDLDGNGEVIGIELLGVSERVSSPEEFDVTLLSREKATV